MTTTLEGDLGNFKMRAPTQGDRLILRDWLRIDPSESGLTDPDFLLGLGPAASSNPACCVIEDAKGSVLFLRASRAARIYLQAAPTTSAEERARNRQALEAAISALATPLAVLGTEQLILINPNAAIRSFAANQLGFSPSAYALIKSLNPAKGR